jgi:hypothetical protein
VRDLIAQIILDLELDSVFVERIDYAGLHLVLPEELSVALVKLPERLVRPLAIDLKLRGQL